MPLMTSHGCISITAPRYCRTGSRKNIPNFVLLLLLTVHCPIIIGSLRRRSAAPAAVLAGDGGGRLGRRLLCGI